MPNPAAVMPELGRIEVQDVRNRSSDRATRS